MKPLFSHDVINSFILWFDNYLMKKAEAYKTYTTKLYYYEDARLYNGQVAYGSPYKQWVFDRSITGAVFPSGVYVNGTFVPEGTSGMLFDYNNGRIVFNSGVSKNLNITGTYTVKEINVNINDQPEDNLVIDNKYIPNSRFLTSETPIRPYNPVTPCTFFSIENVDNKPFAFGGEDQTTILIKAIPFCENLYQLDGVLSTFADSFNEVFSKIPMTQHPINEYGSIKTGLYPTGFYYDQVNLANSATTFFISDVNVSKVRDDIMKELNPIMHIGFIDFEIKTFRYPRNN